VSAKPIELILLRQLASRMPMPVVLVDADGVLVYFNPATERMLGYDSAEYPEFPITAFRELGDPRDADNNPLPVERMPISVALHERRPQQGTLIVHDTDGRPHRIVTTAIPLDGQGGVLLGAMSIFWEEEGEAES
jgi:PAS domain-containing protein